jgi:hypothetical protein
MSLDEPRLRGTLLGVRTDRRRVREAERFFCEACGGWIDARDLVWIEDPRRQLPHPAGSKRSSLTGRPRARHLVRRREVAALSRGSLDRAPSVGIRRLLVVFY